jgi:pilus assembly protein CpaF
MSERITPPRSRRTLAGALAGTIRPRGAAARLEELEQQLDEDLPPVLTAGFAETHTPAPAAAAPAQRPASLAQQDQMRPAQHEDRAEDHTEEAPANGALPTSLPLFAHQDVRTLSTAMPAGVHTPRLITTTEAAGSFATSPVGAPVPWARTSAAAFGAGGPGHSGPAPSGYTVTDLDAGFDVEERGTLQPPAQAWAPGLRRNELANHQLVRQLQRAIGDRLHARIAGLGELTSTDEEMVAQAVATEVISEHVIEREALGETVFTDPAVRQATVHAAVDRVIKHGLLQQYLERDDVENIDAIGYDRVYLSLADGTKERVGPIASSDEDLIETLAMWASRVGQGEKQLSPSNPFLEMPLRDGSRLSASIEVSPRPQINVRRHRHKRVDLGQLVEADMLTEAQASFCAAAVRAHRNIIVSGPPGSGKTTLLRALLAAIEPEEAVGTIETDFELYAHEYPEQYPRVKAWRARTGSGEMAADGTRTGEITVATLMYKALRQNITRMIVGEAREPREVRMLMEAMNAGAGTMSTLHTRSAMGTVSRLVNSLTSGGFSDGYARDQVGEHIDLIIQVEAIRRPDGSYWRRIAEIVEITQGEGEVARTVIFGRRSGERGLHLRTTHVEPQTAPTFLDDLVAEGFDPAWLGDELTLGLDAGEWQ